MDPRALGRFLFDADVRLLRFEYLQEFPGRSKTEIDGKKTCWLNMKLMNIQDLRGFFGGIWLKAEIQKNRKKQPVDGLKLGGRYF